MVESSEIGIIDRWLTLSGNNFALATITYTDQNSSIKLLTELLKKKNLFEFITTSDLQKGTKSTLTEKLSEYPNKSVLIIIENNPENIPKNVYMRFNLERDAIAKLQIKIIMLMSKTTLTTVSTLAPDWFHYSLPSKNL